MQWTDNDGYNVVCAPVAQLDQSIWLRTRGSGVRVSPGAPLPKTVCFQSRQLIPLVLFRTRMERSGRQKGFLIRGSHVLMRLMRLSFIAFTLAFTRFFTNVTGTGFPPGKLTMAFVVAKPASSFPCSRITGGRTCRRMCGFLKLNQANIPS